MSRTIQFKRRPAASVANTVGANGELIIDTTNDTLTIHDGVTSGGSRLATENYVNDQISNATINGSGVSSSYVNTQIAIANTWLQSNDLTTLTAAKSYVDSQISSLSANTFSGDYNDLSNKPSIPTVPTNVSSFTNDAGYTTFSGSYNDLTDTPTLFSGDYNDLSNTPSIPTNVSELTNDSGFITLTDVPETYTNANVSLYLANYDGSINFTASPAIISGVGTISVNEIISPSINTISTLAQAAFDQANTVTDLGVLKISASTIGTKDFPDTDGWGGYSLNLDPGGESYSYIQIPSVEGQTLGATLVIANNNEGNGGIRLSVRDGELIFTDTGLDLPYNLPVRQNNSWTKVTTPFITGGVGTVVWSSTVDYISSAKLVIQVEGNENGDDTGWHSQVCEAIIACRGYANVYGGPGGDPQMIVYGVVHTSVNPLVTFTVQRNPTTKLVEIVATPTAASNGSADLRIHSVEMSTRD